MPDPSGESPPPSRQPPSGSTEAPSPLMPAPRAHPQHAHHAREPLPTKPVSALPPGLDDVLEWLRRNSSKDIPTNASPRAQEPTGRPPRPLRKGKQKFHKYDPEHSEPEPLASGRITSLPPEEAYPPTSSAEDPSPDTSYPRGITPDQLAFIRRLRQESTELTVGMLCGALVVILLAAVGAFLIGRATAPKGSVADRAIATIPQSSAVDRDAASRRLSPVVFDLIDQAMVAESTKNYGQAIECLEHARRFAGHIYGLNYKLAFLHYEANDMTRVIPLLDLSITEGEEVAACCSLRGTISNQSGAVDQGMGDLEKATELDPFSARYPFIWGETLRRAGKPRQALLPFSRAISRLQEPGLLGGYSLKLRLAQTQLGQEDLFAAEMATQLKRIPPPVDWLLTAAAVEMHRGNFSAAAGYLLKTCALIGEHETAMQLQDPYLASFAQEKELRSFFESPASTIPAGTAKVP